MRIYVCDNLKKEAEAALLQLGTPEIKLYSFPALCGRPPLTLQDLDLTLDENEQSLIFGGICLREVESELMQNAVVYRFDNCFELVLEKGVAEYLLHDGAYLMTPGWLADWRDHIERWKFDRQGAQQFFGESCQYLLLLDTGIDSESSKNLREFAEYVGIEAKKIDVTLTTITGHFQNALQKAEADRPDFGDVSAERKRMSDYAMAMDLIRILARNMNEKAVIENILNIFSMLFAPGEMIYLTYENSKPDKLYSQSGLEFDDPNLRTKLKALDQQYAWQPSGKGFMLQLRFNRELLGVISVDYIAFPEYKEHYLNLALFIGEVCGLAISNARTYQIINTQNEKLDLINHELNRREEHYRLLYEMAPLGYQSLGFDGKILNVNQAWLNMLGYKEEEVINRWFGDFLTEESVVQFQRQFPLFLKSGQINDIEFQMLKKNGGVIDISYNGKVLRDIKGNFIRTHCILRDVTKQKEVLRTLRKSAEQGKDLKGFITICAGCNKIKDNKIEGQPWIKPADYFSRRYPELKFSHGICPDCVHKWYPDLTDKINQDREETD